MGVVYTSNVAKIKGDNTQRASLFLRFMAEDIVDTAEPNTPKKIGDLRNRILKQVLGLTGKVVWNVNYAVFQELKQFKNYTTPGTGPHFAENAVNKSRERTADIAKKAGLI